MLSMQKSPQYIVKCTDAQCCLVGPCILLVSFVVVEEVAVDCATVNFTRARIFQCFHTPKLTITFLIIAYNIFCTVLGKVRTGLTAFIIAKRDRKRTLIF